MVMALQEAFMASRPSGPQSGLSRGAFDLLVALGPEVAIRALVQQKLHHPKGRGWIGPEDILPILGHPRAEELLVALAGALVEGDFTLHSVVQVTILTRGIARELVASGGLPDAVASAFAAVSRRGKPIWVRFTPEEVEALADLLLRRLPRVEWPLDRKPDVLAALRRVLKVGVDGPPAHWRESAKDREARMRARADALGIPVQVTVSTLERIGIQEEVNADNLREKAIRRARWHFLQGLAEIGVRDLHTLFWYIPSTRASEPLTAYLVMPSVPDAGEAKGKLNLYLPSDWVFQVLRRGGHLLDTKDGERAIFLSRADEKTSFGLLWRKNRQGKQVFQIALYADANGRPARRLRFCKIQVKSKKPDAVEAQDAK